MLNILITAQKDVTVVERETGKRLYVHTTVAILVGVELQNTIGEGHIPTVLHAMQNTI